jgi:hypothetical protein
MWSCELPFTCVNIPPTTTLEPSGVTRSAFTWSSVEGAQPFSAPVLVEKAARWPRALPPAVVNPPPA